MSTPKLLAIVSTVFVGFATASRADAAYTFNLDPGLGDSETYIGAVGSSIKYCQYPKDSIGGWTLNDIDDDNSTLQYDVDIVGNAYENDVLIVTGSIGSICGTTFSTFGYGTHYMDLYGMGAKDVLNAGTGDTFIYGGDGDDCIFSENPNGHFAGGGGNDTIYAYSASGSGESLYGEDGEDCLYDSSNDAFIFDCGPDTDTYRGTTSPRSACEGSPVGFCP